jgi:RNA polymerase sigma factor (sigma-70 family)
MSAETNKQKFESFFRTEYNKLVHFVRKNLEDRFFGSSPEDIVQDVALSILNKLDVDQQFENLAGYIYRSLKNRTIDAGRQKNIPESTDNLENLVSNEIQSLSEESDYDFLREMGVTPDDLHNCIGKLKPDEQAIIILTEFERRSFAELSERWDVPIGTLLSRKHRALAKLYKLLIENDKTKTIKINDYGNKRKLLPRQQVV